MKIKNLAPFELGVDYRELSPKEGSSRFRWVTLKDIELEFTFALTHYNEAIKFKDNIGKTWLTLRGYKAILSKDYAWNGNTPKLHVPIFGWIGTPDYKKTRRASAWHDVFTQMIYTQHMPLSMDEVNDVFYDILSLDKFCLRGVFNGAVRRLGPLFGKPQDVYSVLELELQAN